MLANSLNLASNCSCADCFGAVAVWGGGGCGVGGCASWKKGFLASGPLTGCLARDDFSVCCWLGAIACRPPSVRARSHASVAHGSSFRSPSAILLMCPLLSLSPFATLFRSNACAFSSFCAATDTCHPPESAHEQGRPAADPHTPPIHATTPLQTMPCPPHHQSVHFYHSSGFAA